MPSAEPTTLTPLNPTRPVEVSADAAITTGHDATASTPIDRVCAVIVTWNRKALVSQVLDALSRQTYPTKLLDLVIVDNAGTDGTLEHLITAFNPERIVDNRTDKAHEPAFDTPRHRTWGVPTAPNTLGLASITIVRNQANMGGCGGFNTGFAFVEHWFGKPGFGGPEYVWLVDDDIDLPTDTLANLVEAMRSHPTIGLVGSRTCDINDRARTIETTIYFNSATGSMQDDAPAGHRRHAAHKHWVQTVGGPRGRGGATGYRGTMDVDVVSACSMLARWKAVLGDGQRSPGVGFWDHRYFIYCDDADWCLRFARAGWRVVLNLDAVVFHTPWNLKLTPARIYYANRNRLWMVQKVLPTETLRTVTAQVMRSFLFDAMHAALHRRQFHADIILNTGLDVVNGVAGKTGSDGPPPMPTLDALRQAGCLRPGAKVAVVCNVHDSITWFHALQAHVASMFAASGKPGETLPQWQIIARNDVNSPPPPADAIVYGKHLKSRLKKQLWLLKARPTAVVVFDQINDFPVLLAAKHTLHLDHRKPEQAQLESEGWSRRIKFAVRWLKARRAMLNYAANVEPYVSATRYG